MNTTDPRQRGTGATWFVPSISGEPLLIDLPGANLDFAVITRESLGGLDESWSVPGTYVLLDPTDASGRTGVYVGKAPGGLTTRIRQHVRVREEWRRALLIRRPYQGFNSAEVGWLEGRLYDVLNSAARIAPGNGNRPSDETLAPWQRQQLEAIIGPVLGVLRALGLDPDTPDQQAPQLDPKPATPRARHEANLTDLLQAGLISDGSVLHPTTSSYEGSATVMADGTLTVHGQPHASLSSAGKAITGHSVNGWEFWGLLSGSGELVPMTSLRGPSAQHDFAPEAATSLASSANPDQRTDAERPEALPADRGTVDLLTLLQASALSVGDVLTVRYKGTEYRATVTADGHLSLSGRDYPSPTAAAVAITGSNVNGWRFWKVQTGQTLGSLRGQLDERDH
ncbi:MULTISPECIES: DUF2924 domain-containing protein [unclassified Modestobacter]|uniref:restriction system modified-DNA reader domain-containing protein n=1 Tax=unclassified Modestobacter TaxID=2643866 RepID=UPI0022AB17EB|nr:MULTISPECIES: DUF2924 domain-containing protein [unclassified Modestobacter]MCZ2826090.1 DUF2924 domain-containing protein [Modestobacter sp. VKM Ac-2981]MCZ2852845.1 DUF2924 domain-containing protein [Modestobacter sp. VKM Ac-2982]